MSEFTWTDDLVDEYRYFRPVSGFVNNLIEQFKKSKQPKPKEWEIQSYVMDDYKGEKNEIFSGLSFNKGRVFTNKRGMGLFEYELELNAKIHSVKRLSDNEVFTIGDKFNGGKEILKIECERYCSIGSTGSIRYNLMFVKKDNWQPLFTTHDGVDIYPATKYWHVDSHFIIKDYFPSVGGSYPKSYLTFSTKEKAESWVIENKPCLSVSDITSLQMNQSAFGYKFNFLDVEKLKELAKSKMKL